MEVFGLPCPKLIEHKPKLMQWPPFLLVSSNQQNYQELKAKLHLCRNCQDLESLSVKVDMVFN